MTAAFDERSERQKQAAILRSLADQVASPVVAGRKSRKALSDNQRWQWRRITDHITKISGDDPVFAVADTQARAWKATAKSVGIGAGLFGWLVWNWAFPLLLELAKRWIESQRLNESRVSDR